MKKYLICYLLFLLPALILPAISFAYSEKGSPPTAAGELPCPLPPPSWLIATDITANSITLEWEAVASAYYYKVKGYDITASSSLPTYYPTINTITYSGLTPGHTYEFSVAASSCPGGPTGDSIILRKTTTAIIIDGVVEFADPCSPTYDKSTGSNVTYNFCVQESETEEEDYTNGFIGQLQMNGGTESLEFGLALVNQEVILGEMTSSNFYFVLDPDSQGAECKYSAIPPISVFRIDYLQYYIATSPSSPNWANMSITFYDSWRHFAYCPEPNLPCTQGEDDRSSGESGPQINDSFSSEMVFRSSEKDIIQTQISPNPFSEFATIRYELMEAGAVEIRLYDATGRLVQEVESTTSQAPGRYEARVERAGLPDGVYFLHVMTGQNREVFSLVKRE